MTPENTFRERRSAYVDEGEESPAPSPADPAEVRVDEGEESRAPSPADPAEARPDEADRPAGEEAGVIETPAGEATTEAPAGEVDLDQLDRMEIPEPSFLELVQPLEVQALQFLGVVPLTEGGEKRVLPRWAKHVIDLLGILEERTRGNLPEDEKRYLDQVLSELRMRYLRVSR